MSYTETNIPGTPLKAVQKKLAELAFSQAEKHQTIAESFMYDSSAEGFANYLYHTKEATRLYAEGIRLRNLPRSSNFI